MSLREDIARILWDNGLPNGDFVAGKILAAIEEMGE